MRHALKRDLFKNSLSLINNSYLFKIVFLAVTQSKHQNSESKESLLETVH